MPRCISFVAVLAFLMVLLPVLQAQEVTASMTGRVVDATGAVVPGVKIAATHVETNTTREVESNSTGDFLIPLLRPGSYKISAAQPGFKTYEQSGITLEVNQRARIDIVLQVGQVSDRVEVTAEAPTITTENATVGKVIDNKSISMMPLNGRLNITGLMTLAPGI